MFFTTQFAPNVGPVFPYDSIQSQIDYIWCRSQKNPIIPVRTTWSVLAKSSSFNLQVKYDFLYDHYHVCCQESWRSLTYRQVYTTFIMVALFLLPLAAMLFLYTRIGIELWIRKRVGDASVLNTMNHREIGKISRWVEHQGWLHHDKIQSTHLNM